MAGEFGDAWTDEAIARYERIEATHTRYQQALKKLEVAVRSADGTVEVVVAADGDIRSIVVDGAPPQLNAALLDAVRSAAEASAWAQRKLHSEEFGAYPPLGAHPAGAR